MLCITAAVGAPAWADPKDEEEAKFVASVADQVVEAFATGMPTDERRAEFERIVATVIDTDTLVPHVTGEYWDEATDDQKRALTKAFLGYAVRTYADFLLNAFVERYTITSVRPREPGKVEVDTRVTRKFEDRRPTYGWTVVNYGNGTFKVMDVSEAGFSLAEALRNDCQSILREAGINGLIRALYVATQAS